jgi:nucleoside-diphosphate-sugar epimerase
VQRTDADLLLVTGATGLVGGHVVEEACRRGLRVRALARPSADATLLRECGVEIIPGDMTDTLALRRASEGATMLVHAAAKVGDWGPVESYRDVNVRGLENLLAAAREAGSLRKMVHVSSLGVYPARDHHGTDESTVPSTAGIDGYTLTKVEAEQVVRRHIDENELPAVILRPGFIYGPRDRTVLPRLLEKIKSGQFKFLGSSEKLMNNTYVGNLVSAIFLALENDAATGEVYNVTDGRLVSKREFVHTAAEMAGYKKPTGTVPLPVAKGLATAMEGVWKLLGKQEAPLLSGARIKFLGLNLDFSIAKARRELGFDPQIDFTEGMRRSIDWFRQHDRLP